MKYNFDEIIPRESTNSVKYDLRNELFGKEDLIPMWVADMDFATPHFIIEAIEKRCEHPVFGYSIRSNKYYQSIIDWQEKQHNWKIEKDWIKFSPGIVPALNLCVMAFTEPGDKIIVQPPVYFPFFTAIKNHGRVQVDNPLKLENGRLNMDFDDLEKKIDSGVKMIFLCNPHNPGGSVWRKEELAKMAEICLKHDVLMISDEIHCDLVLPPNQHNVLAMLSDEVAEKTISCIAPSKTFNLAGMATSSVIISNKELQEKFDKTMEAIHVGMGNLFGAVASEAAYTHGEKWLDQLKAYIKENVEFALQYFEKHIPKIRAIKPEATYMVWLDCRELDLKDDELFKFFTEKAGVGLNRGDMFGVGGEGFLRMNLACPRSIVQKALSKIKHAIDSNV